MGKGCQAPNTLKPDLYLTRVSERLKHVMGAALAATVHLGKQLVAAEAAPTEASTDVLWISATAGNEIGGQPPFSGS